jgi:hypothetical protein
MSQTVPLPTNPTPGPNKDYPASTSLRFGSQKLAEIGTREQQKVSSLIFYSSPSNAPKLISLSGISLKKILSLNRNLFNIIYQLVLGNSTNLRVDTYRPVFTPTERGERGTAVGYLRQHNSSHICKHQQRQQHQQASTLLTSLCPSVQLHHIVSLLMSHLRMPRLMRRCLHLSTFGPPDPIATTNPHVALIILLSMPPDLKGFCVCADPSESIAHESVL